MTDSLADPKDRRGFGLPLAIAIAAGLVWSVVDFQDLIRQVAPGLHAGDYAGPLGALTGHTLVIAGIVGAIVYVAMLRRSASSNAAPFFAILFAVILACNFAGMMLIKTIADRGADNAQYKIAQTEISNAYRVVSAAGRPSDIDMRIKSGGDAGIMERLTKGFAVTILTDRRDYRAELAALGFPGFLTPQALAARGGFANAQARLASARQVVAKYSALNHSRFTEFRAAIVGSKLGEEVKSGMLKGVDESNARQQASRERIWILEDSILAEHSRLVADLAHPKGRWVLKDNVWRFSNPADLAAFKAHSANIRALQTEEKTLLGAAKDRLNQDLASPPHQTP